MRYLLLLTLLPCASYGQGTARAWRGSAVQPELQAELTPNEHSYAYLALGGLRYSDNNSLVTSRTLGLDTRYLSAGYEQQLTNSKWSWGATFRVAGAAGFSTAFQPGLLLRHRSALGPLVLGQRLAAEYALTGDSRLDPAYNLASKYTAVSRTLLRLRLDLYRQNGIQITDGLNLSPRLSFEPALFLRLQREANEPDKRTVDFTALRADVTVRFANAWLDVTPWFALQTQYLSTLIQLDANGNPTSNGKYNRRLPSLGVEVRYNLSHKAEAEGQFRLPTQH